MTPSAKSNLYRLAIVWFSPQPELSVMSFPINTTPVAQTTARKKSITRANLSLSFSRQ